MNGTRMKDNEKRDRNNNNNNNREMCVKYIIRNSNEINLIQSY